MFISETFSIYGHEIEQAVIHPKLSRPMKTKRISMFLILGVISAVFIYAIFLLILTLPITNLSINQTGVFGDSFGLLTSLFSGLAFSGMIITILLQKEELSLQREELVENRREFIKGVKAQERNYQLSALTALLNEYKSQIALNEVIIERNKQDSKYRGIQLKKTLAH